MVVDDLHVIGIAVSPFEADAPLIVDPYAVLTSATTFELLQSIRGWTTEIGKSARVIDHPEFPKSDLLDISRQAAGCLPREDPRRFLVAEGDNHCIIV